MSTAKNRNCDTSTKSGISNGADDDIVISGLSGKYPNCQNVKDFEYMLYNKINMVDDAETRWVHNIPGVPRYGGKVPDLDRFDGTFFGVHNAQIQLMDPQNRIFIEESFKAIMDAGVNPYSLRGSNTGVYVGTCFSESKCTVLFNREIASGFGVTGISKAMIANRVSFILGLTGPSLQCDTACSSSMYALDLAYKAFKSGQIDAAIVGGTHLCLHPNITRQFALLGVLSLESHCSPFDECASGYTRSEAISAIYLQKRSVAKRIYAEVIASKTNCDGFKPEGITAPSSLQQENLMREIYASANVDINDLGYFEAHSTGTVVGDPMECNAIDRAICSKRNESLLVGSVKSNCGHTESASGLCSVTKVIFALENGLVPPNINYKNMRKEIKALTEGRLKVVVEPTVLSKPLIGINSFGFGGANAHAILKQHDKKKIKNEKSFTLPRLITWAARTEEILEKFFTDLESKPLDEEYLALIQSAQAGGIKGMVYRGYSILKSQGIDQNPLTLSKNCRHENGTRRPIVWVFSGMESQWVGMGTSLMQLPIIRQSIQRCHNVLKPMGVNLIEILTSNDPNMFANILHCFVGNAAIQIALVDVLRALDIKPDFIIGHSVGELGCAYADNCFTAEQMILAAYYRGKVSLTMNKIKGSMAAIGVGFKQIVKILPNTIDVAFQNNKESCTISGPSEDVTKFVELLKSNHIYAREVPCSNIAYHSRYISQFGPELVKSLKQIIPRPLMRSTKWISTSIPRSEWFRPICKYSSAEYHTNNLLSSVLFEEATLSIPKNSITIEIAPHALLHSILKGSIPHGIYVGLTERGNPDSILYLLNAIGGLYENGLEPRIEKLYPEVDWPVSRGTPSISPIIEFNHTEERACFHYVDHDAVTGCQQYKVKLSGAHQYIKGHQIDGRVLVPATFYLECAWKALSAFLGRFDITSTPIEFENVKFIRATTLNETDEIVLNVSIHRKSGQFEITESDSLVTTGFVRELKDLPRNTSSISMNESSAWPLLSKKDFYKELKLRGYHYNGDFQSVEIARADGSYGKIFWKNNWVSFMDCMLQMGIIYKDARTLMLPTKIRNLKIYPKYHLSTLEPDCLTEVFCSQTEEKIISGGIEITGLHANTVQRRKPPGEPVLESYQFVPHFPSAQLCLEDIARCCIQLALENQPSLKLELFELSLNEPNPNLLQNLLLAVEHLPMVTGSCMLFHNSPNLLSESVAGVTLVSDVNELNNISPHIVVGTADDIRSETFSTTILPKMNANGFLIVKEKANLSMTKFNSPTNFLPIAFFPTSIETIVVLKRNDSPTDLSRIHFLNISVSDNSFQWIQKLKELIKPDTAITLIAQNEKFNGILGLVNCLRKEPETKNVKCILIDDPSAPVFDIENPFYSNQLKLDLALNVLKKGKWGTYRHLLLKQEYPLVPQSDVVYGNIQRIGEISSLKWLQSPIRKNESVIRIVYSSLNFRDIMLASGRLPLEIIGPSRMEQQCVFGFEFSGIDLRNYKRVMGMVVKSAVASNVPDDSPLIWEIPKHWSLQEAATVPVVYLTVYYAFFVTVDIRQGKSILIHAGSGGIGISAIRVALAYGLEVFTTVSTAEKKKFLLKTFPALKEQNIGNSRDTSFEDMVMECTDGKGVDFVLNSLSEEKLLASVRCLGKRGHFLEIGKFDMANDNSLGLGPFLNELSFHAVLADNLLISEMELINKLKEYINTDIQNGIIQPLPSTVFKAQEIEPAFRYLMSGKHIGKVLIQVRDDPNSDRTMPISVIPQIYFSPQHVYIIPGGLGGFGMELADWMILRRARKIVFNSTRGISNDYQKLRIALWKTYGCTIAISTADIGTDVGCLELIRDSMKLGSVGGIFNLAVVLRDAIFPNQTEQLFQESFKPKALATKYLDDISRKLCPDLQHFVIFSSVSCGRGNAGQTNYGMANSIMEQIIENRIADGLPAKAIQWGAVGEVGLVAELANGMLDLEIGGTLQQRISSCLDVLDALLSSPDAIVSSMVVAEKKASSAEQTPFDFVLNLMSIRDVKSISLTSTLAELGMDSLMGVEIKQALERDYDIILSSTDLSALTFEKLIEISKNAKQMDVEFKTAINSEYEESLNLLYYYVGNDFSYSETFDDINEVTKGTPIIIFPGIDGYSGDIWRTIGRNLECPAYVIQLLKNDSITSIRDFAQFAYENISKLLQAKKSKKFQIVAYSYGTLIAHITIAMLEEAGYEGRVVFIDGSPLFIQELITTTQRLYTKTEIDKLVIRTLINLVIPEMTNEILKKEMENLNVRSELASYTRDRLNSHRIKGTDKILDYIDSMLLKVQIIQNSEEFESIPTIRSQILLVKPTKATIKDIDETYWLAPISRGEIIFHVLEGNHQSILRHEHLPAVLNKYFNQINYI